MFWKKKDKEICFHEWKVSDFYVRFSFMSDIERTYEITCAKCKKQRKIDDYEYNQMKNKGFITT